MRLKRQKPLSNLRKEEEKTERGTQLYKLEGSTIAGPTASNLEAP